MKNYYQTLGVEENASQDEIRKAFRTLSKKYHPDTTQGDDTKFKEIQEAYSTLSNKEARKMYDLKRKGGPSFKWKGVNMGFGQSEPDDFFEEVFKRYAFDMGGFASRRTQQHRPTKRRGADIKVEAKLSVEEGFTGRVFEIPIKRREYIKGEYRKVDRVFKVNIKRGFIPGKPIRLTGEGHCGVNGGANGDIIVIPFIKPHPFFFVDQRKNITCEISLHYTQLILGDKISVKGPDGSEEVEVNIPEGTKEGEVIVVKNKGWPLGENSRSNLNVKVHMSMNLTEGEKQLLKNIYNIANTKKVFNYN